ncbi:MAG: GPR endopeptidase [Oscillospiraceae bacterium]|jgi:spore protease|nr:GPR endopeptidase [Oscillospiraceae bacterium]
MPYPRTDLALELHERAAYNAPSSAGVTKEELARGESTVTRIRVASGASDFGKPPGVYVTVRFPGFLSEQPPDAEQAKIIAEELSAILPKTGTVLVLGLGNAQITPDALGPRTVRHILTTRGRERLGGVQLREVCALAPGVFAQTGLEAREVLSGLLEQIHPTAVVAIDALAAGDIARLGNTVQLTDAGISPGSGVENSRPELSADTLGVPVIAIGVPTVVDYNQEAESETVRPLSAAPSMFVTPRGIDLLTERAARLIALAVNLALQPGLAPEDLVYLTAE